MIPRINLITLGVKNIAASRKFYEEGLGWKPSSMSNDHFVAFDLQGLIFCLYPVEALAEDAGVKVHQEGFKGITLSQTLPSKEEVDALLKHAESVGAQSVKAARDVFWGGYVGHFADPDGHFWEIAWNPHWPLRSDGTLELPE